MNFLSTLNIIEEAIFKDKRTIYVSSFVFQMEKNMRVSEMRLLAQVTFWGSVAGPHLRPDERAILSNHVVSRSRIENYVHGGFYCYKALWILFIACLKRSSNSNYGSFPFNPLEQVKDGRTFLDICNERWSLGLLSVNLGSLCDDVNESSTVEVTPCQFSGPYLGGLALPLFLTALSCHIRSPSTTGETM